MYLYSLTLQRATAITHAIYGNFSAPKAQEIVVAKGKVLELLRPTDSGKIQTVLSMDVFGVIRSLMPFRLTGECAQSINLFLLLLHSINPYLTATCNDVP